MVEIGKVTPADLKTIAALAPVRNAVQDAVADMLTAGYSRQQVIDHVELSCDTWADQQGE